MYELGVLEVMNHYLENAWLQLKIDTANSRWSLISRHRNSPFIEEAQVAVGYSTRRGRKQGSNLWQEAGVSNPEIIPSPHGPLRQLALQVGPDQSGLVFTLTYALPENHALLLWKFSIANRGSHPVYVDRWELLSAGFIYQSRLGPHGRLHFSPQAKKSHKIFLEPGKTNFRETEPIGLPGEYAFFSNGWQSWSNTQVYTSGDRFRKSRLVPLRAPIISNPDTPRPRRTGLFGSDMFGILCDTDQRRGILLGFLSQKRHFGSLEAWIGSGQPALRLWASGDRVQLHPGNQMETDWAVAQFLHLDTYDPLGLYLETVARECGLDPGNPTESELPKGWCSWYHFFRQVTAGDIQANLAAAADRRSDLPLDIFQIDDGFEAQVGDWFETNDRFREGLQPLANEIREAGFTPGLWLAPFLVDPRSKLARRHPDWLLRGRLRGPVNAGHLWNTFHTALDLTHPDALAYVADLVKTAVDEWRFPYLKLDFLYAAALPGRRRNATQTRAEVLRAGLEVIRTAAGKDTFLLGCGCPLGPAIGLVDAMRIGADVAHRWKPTYRGIQRFFRGEPDLPSARNAIHNTLTRSALHRRWWINDPDCLLLGPIEIRGEQVALDLAETQTLATVIALTGGSFFLSDHLPSLPPERLRLAQTLIPLIGKRPHVLDWFDNQTPRLLQLDLDGATGKWHLLAVFNWEDAAQDIHVDLKDFYLDLHGEYRAREFWRGANYPVNLKETSNPRIVLPGLPAHGTALLAVRTHRPYQPGFLGSDLHISQGLEVKDWKWKRSSSSERHSELRFRIERPGSVQGIIDLYLPTEPGKVSVNGNPIALGALDEHVYRLPVAFDRKAEIEIMLQQFENKHML